jgi:hypothetical protein
MWGGTEEDAATQALRAIDQALAVAIVSPTLWGEHRARNRVPPTPPGAASPCWQAHSPLGRAGALPAALQGSQGGRARQRPPPVMPCQRKED